MGISRQRQERGKLSEEDEFLEEEGPLASIELEENGIYLLFGDINDAVSASVCAWILGKSLADEKPKQLTLLINSPGGSLSSAFAMIEVMKGSPIPIHTVGLGQICSAGLIIFMNGEKGYRTLTPTCSVMTHHFSTVVGGSYHELVHINRELKFTHERILNNYAAATGLSEENIMKQLLNEKDTYLSPTEAVGFGIGDRISELSS